MLTRHPSLTSLSAAFSRVMNASSLDDVSGKTNQQVRRYHEVTGDILCPSMIRGIDHLRDPRLNKVILINYYLSNKYNRFV